VAAPDGHRCAECGAELAGDQRYCLQCGARAGEPDPALRGLLARVSERGQPWPAPEAAVPATPGEPAASGGSWIPDLQLPSRPVSALLVAGFLGFGILLGSAAGGRGTSLADSRAPLRVVLPPSTASGTGGAGTGEASQGGGEASTGAEAPASEAEATPAPAKTTTASSPTGKGSGSEGEQGSGSEQHSSESSTGAATKLPPIHHVFVIMLSDEPYASSFGPASTASYLTHTLEHSGELLVRYDAVAHEELANGVALMSGQGPTAEIAANCPTYAAIAPATAAASGQVLGNGCVFPTSVSTLPGQLAAKHLSWRAYVGATDEPGAPVGACAHPALGSPDPTAAQTATGGAYATFTNPLVYFQSIVSSPTCAADDVGLSRLKGDLGTAKRTASLSYIVPDRCQDGNPSPCTAGAAAGMGPADAFLRRVVPEILASSAYKKDGLLVITDDEAPSSGEFADSSSCCGEPHFPNAPQPTTIAGLPPRGGGQVGALLLSPYLKGGTTTQEEFNHYSLLRTVEDLFGLGHLGYAGLPAVKSLPPAMFTAKPSH
jgi:hypothetical protein